MGIRFRKSVCSRGWANVTLEGLLSSIKVAGCQSTSSAASRKYSATERKSNYKDHGYNVKEGNE